MGRIKLDPCFDCGSEDIYWDLYNWQLICRNCEAECPLPNEPLNKFEMAKCWNQMQEAKLQSQSDGHDKMAVTNDKTAEEAAEDYMLREWCSDGDGGYQHTEIAKMSFLAGFRWTKEQVTEFCLRRALECRPGKETGYVEGQSDAFGEVAAFLEGMK
jgi:hypothetical protein